MATRRVTCRSRSACRRGVPRAPVCRCALAGPGRPSSASQRTLRSRQPGGARRQAPGAAATELAPAATAFEELAAGTARKYVMVSGKGGVGKISLILPARRGGRRPRGRRRQRLAVSASCAGRRRPRFGALRGGQRPHVLLSASRAGRRRPGFGTRRRGRRPRGRGRQRLAVVVPEAEAAVQLAGLAGRAALHHAVHKVRHAVLRGGRHVTCSALPAFLFRCQRYDVQGGQTAAVQPNGVLFGSRHTRTASLSPQQTRLNTMQTCSRGQALRPAESWRAGSAAPRLLGGEVAQGVLLRLDQAWDALRHHHAQLLQHRDLARVVGLRRARSRSRAASPQL